MALMYNELNSIKTLLHLVMTSTKILATDSLLTMLGPMLHFQAVQNTNQTFDYQYP